MNGLFSGDNVLQARFILLAGDDVAAREAARDDIIASVKKQEPAAEVERYDSESSDFTVFFERIITPSLLSPLRVFVIPEAHQLPEKDLESLESLLPQDIPDACVILESGKLRSRKKTKEAALSKKYAAFLDAFDEAMEKTPSRFIVQSFPMPAEWEMAQWVTEYAPKLSHRRISPEDAQRLVDMVGADTGLLRSELDKLDIFLDDGSPITADAIDAVSGAARQSTQFELAQALGEKNTVRVLEIIETIYTGNVYLPLFTGAVFRHFWSLFRLHLFAKEKPALLWGYRSSSRPRKNEAALALAVGAGLFSENQANRLYPMVIKPRLIEQAVSFSYRGYRRIFALLAEFDTGIKTGRYDDSKTGFQIFCQRIIRAGA
jgi:DNA polymerase III delta subunit